MKNEKKFPRKKKLLLKKKLWFGDKKIFFKNITIKKYF
jgi:hypothetical protein